MRFSTEALAFGWLKRNCREPQPVGGKRPNPWGLYDLIGNVGEYCLDGMIDYPTGNFDDFVAPPNNPYRAHILMASNYMNHERPYDQRFMANPMQGSTVGFRVLRELPK